MNARILKYIAFLFLISVAGSSVFASDGEFRRSLSVGNNLTLDVTTNSGRIIISPGNDNNVTIVGNIHIEDKSYRGDAKARALEVSTNPPIFQNGDKITIGKRRESDARLDFQIDYDITVPRTARVFANTGAGEIHISGIPGVELATTGSGNVLVTDVGGPIRAESGAGQVQIEGQPTGNWTVQSGAGNIILKVGTSANFMLDASSGSGELLVRVPILIASSLQNFQLKAKVNNGGPLLKVSTGAGQVHIY